MRRPMVLLRCSSLAALVALAGGAGSCAHEAAASPRATPVPEPAVASSSPSPSASSDPREDPTGWEVVRVVDAHAGQVRACYLPALARDPRLAGAVVVAWTIARDGAVRDVKVLKRELADDGVIACLTAAVASWSFSPQPEEADVAYPFVFSAE